MNDDRAKRPKQIVICGFSRSGSTLLYNMMRHSANNVFSPDHEASAIHFLNSRQRTVLTKRPTDVFEIADLYRRNGGKKDVRLILTIRDPRTLISSMHRNVPDQWFMGYDHCFFVGERLSYHRPGVLDIHQAVLKALSGPFPAFVCRYEDLVHAPEEMRGRLAEFLDVELPNPFSEFMTRKIPQSLTTALNGIRPAKAIRDWRSSAEQMDRILRQFRLAPELFDILEYWGYETSRQWADAAMKEIPSVKVDKALTIVSYFTENTRYKFEAERLAKSVQRCGLPVIIQQVENRGSWLENVRFKAKFLMQRRQEIRGPLLWVDCDAVLHSSPRPYLSCYDADIAVSTEPEGRIMSGTLWLNDTPGCIDFLQMWDAQTIANPKLNDQVALEHAIDLPRSYTVQYLPPSLCYIFDISKDAYPNITPVIEHLQASREGRRRGARNREALQRRHNRVTKINADLGVPDLATGSAEVQDFDLNPSWSYYLKGEGCRRLKAFVHCVLGPELSARIFHKWKMIRQLRRKRP